jgi:hypothetical protein
MAERPRMTAAQPALARAMQRAQRATRVAPSFEGVVPGSAVAAAV